MEIPYIDMKILILNQHFYPEIAATAQLATDLAEDLVRKGMTVSVVTGMPSYTKEKKLRMAPLFERYRGINIHRVITTPFDKNERVGRILNYISFYLFALIRVFSIPRHDIVIAMSTPPLVSLIGILLKKLRGSKFYYWVQDLYPDIAIAMGVIKERGVFGRLCKKASLLAYRHADVLVPIGEKMAEKMREQGVAEEKIRVIHNWADPEDFNGTDGGRNPIREKLGLEGKFVVLYSGNIGVVHEFDTVKSAMLELRDDENLAFLFIGDGVKKKDLVSFVERNELQNVHFLPYQPREELKNSMNAGDAILITQNDRSAGLMVPSKIYAALAVGKPVLAVGPEKSELSEIVQEKGCGVFLNNGGVEKFVSALEQLSGNGSLYEAGFDNGREDLIADYSRSEGTGRFQVLLAAH